LLAFGIPWSNAFFNLGVYGLLACFVLSGVWWRPRQWARLPVLVALSALLFAAVLLGLLYTQAEPSEAWADVGHYRKLLAVGLLIWALNAPAKRRAAMVAYAAGVVALMLFTLLDGTGLAQGLHLSLAAFEDQSYRHFMLERGAPNLVYWRNQIVHGFHVSILIVLSLMAAVANKRWRLPLALLAAWACWDMTMWIHGRMALLSLVAALLIFGCLQLPGARHRVILLLSLSAVVLVAAFAVAPVRARLHSVFAETAGYVQHGDISTSAGHRFHYWALSWKLFQSAPLLGAGPGAFRSTLVRTQDPFAVENHSHAHNEYITWLSQQGVLGLGLLLLLLGTALAQATRLQDPVLRGFAIGGLLLFALNASTDSSLYNYSEGWTLVLLLALIAGARREAGPPHLA